MYNGVQVYMLDVQCTYYSSTMYYIDDMLDTTIMDLQETVTRHYHNESVTVYSVYCTCIMHTYNVYMYMYYTYMYYAYNVYMYMYYTYMYYAYNVYMYMYYTYMYYAYNVYM